MSIEASPTSLRRPRLRVDGVRCRRGGRLVLEDVGFGAAAGEAVALRGPNGAGKSTLLRALCGLTPVESGRIAFDDAELGGDPEGFRARLIYCGHLDAVKPVFTAREQLGWWARLYGAPTDADAMLDALDALGLEPLADTPVGLLSAGQKRRLGLARLAAIDRPLWLLDEPTTALDARAVAAFAALVRRRLDSGGVVVAATHVTLGFDDLRTVDLTPTPTQSARAAAPAH